MNVFVGGMNGIISRLQVHYNEGNQSENNSNQKRKKRP